MGSRENKVENLLKKEAKALGILTRKWVSPGISGVPDQLLIVPLTKEQAHRLVDAGVLRCMVLGVEVKTDSGVLTEIQKREHDRLREAGVPVDVVYGANGVAWAIDWLKRLLA